MMTSKSVMRIVVVGGGFAGVRVARNLAESEDAHITLVSDRNYFAYYPQLYHAATGGVRSQSAIPLSEMLADLPVELVIDAAVSIDPTKKTITTKSKKVIAYDRVIFALGSVTNYFGIKGLPEYSYGIKTIEEAERFKQHLHQQLIHHGRLEAHFVIVGAGPTGVELSAALTDYLKYLAKHHHIAKPHYRVDLVEAAPRVLPRSPEAVSQKVHERLERLGVNVMTSAVVEGETSDALQLKGESIKTQTVVWTSGVTNNPFYIENSKYFKLAKGNKVVVDEHLQASEGVYVLGDNAATTYAGLAQTAIGDADFVTSDIKKILAKRPRTPYQPKRPSPVTPVGSRWAVAELGSVHVYGYLGWMIRRMADLIAYQDVEPLPQALRTWLREPQRQNNCPVCKNS